MTGVIRTIYFFLILFLFSCLGGMERKKKFKEQIGTYALDVNNTALGNYSKDSNLYKKLRITFNPDATFSMNMKVPFMYDSVGGWEAGNIEEWNYLKYRSFDYSNAGTGEQFSRPHYPDSSFLLNSSTPQKGAEFITKIYFKKISR